ncbi:gluconate 2-dehydrogenase subunit 3 family protein, partial [Jatrophihabitans endophyticus]|uniref:gluconate 2-dehydrogenase subunit 3 family protein n=1 Tax=Jatrophihabitans endophyticus TaxID=1206085 RepID=UPI001A09DA45
QHAVTPQNRGRFPGFDVLDQAHMWDDVTAGAVLARLTLPNMLSFFTPHEVGIAQPMLDLILDQDAEPRVPVLPLIDARLSTGETDGWHYDDLPGDGQAWRDTLGHLDQDARQRHDAGYAELTRPQQARLLQDVQDLSGDGKQWHGVSAKHVWSLWTRYACAAFYSHPWAWNEIGFSGPAYPRGYLNPGLDKREKWEVADHDDLDPTPFAQRVERARKADDDLHRAKGADDE